MTAIFLLLGVWRSWLGGGIGKDWPITKGLPALQYAVLAALVMGARYLDWAIGLVDLAGLWVLARGYGHGPMLRFPLGVNDKDIILRAVGGPGGGTLRYLAYAGIRYVVPACAWSGVLLQIGAHGWWAPVAGAMAIVLTYASFTRIAVDLPTFTTPGDEAANWSEIVGWSLLGAALYAIG